MIIKEAYLQEKDHSKASTSYTPFAQVNSSNIQPVIRWIKAASQDPNSNGNVETDTLKRIRSIHVHRLYSPSVSPHRSTVSRTMRLHSDFQSRVQRGSLASQSYHAFWRAEKPTFRRG